MENLRKEATKTSRRQMTTDYNERYKSAKNLEEESKLIEAGFEYVRFSDKDAVAIYRKRK